MTKNPYLNALIASLYIVFVVLLITYGPMFVREKPDTILAPMAMLSLLVLSVAFMGYTFIFRPALMYMDGQKSEAIGLFTRTLLTFSIITAVIVIVAFSV
ncbi:MAG: hypothetical protein WC648_00560 [Candidatus Paceibacterota bacterium]|jgi:hypothetical protein